MIGPAGTRLEIAFEQIQGITLEEYVANTMDRIGPLWEQNKWAVTIEETSRTRIDGLPGFVIRARAISERNEPTLLITILLGLHGDNAFVFHAISLERLFELHQPIIAKMLDSLMLFDPSLYSADDHGDTFGTARHIGVGQRIFGVIEDLVDVDYFLFSGRAGETYQVEVELRTLPDALLILGSPFTSGVARCRLTASVDHDNTGSPLLRWPITMDGPYFITVENSTGMTTGTYTLRLNSTVDSPTDDHGDEFCSATFIDTTDDLSGTIDEPTEADWFAFEAEVGKTYTVVASPEGLNDPFLGLWGTDGKTLLAFDRDFGDTLEPRIRWTAPESGTYFLNVESSDRVSRGTYRLSFAPSSPMATPVPSSATSPAQENIQGILTIAVSDTGTPNGLPRFCATGCSENIYLSGITETLFNSKELSNGGIAIEPMLALDFTLDHSLNFGDFSLREGVQFQSGWGEMTADDVAFSYNDANSVTEPESIHGQAGDFAPLIARMEPRDTYTVRLNYRNYDRRGILHRFSSFWQTAGIVSKGVFDELGAGGTRDINIEASGQRINLYTTQGSEGMQDVVVGVGPYQVEGWIADEGIFLTAFPDYYGTPLGLGPFVGNVRWLQVPENASRRAMLETEEAQIAQIAPKDLPQLKTNGFSEQKGALHNANRSISFAGNYWEQFSALTGELNPDRDRDTTNPWVGNPFEMGEWYDEDTPSMRNSRLVRNALAHAVDRQEMLDNLAGGFGFVNHQPYLSINNPNYLPEWNWDTDLTLAKKLMEQAGQSNGFGMELRIGTDEGDAELGDFIGSAWQQSLEIKVDLIKTDYTTNLDLISRTTNIPLLGCDDENHSNFPYDWAHGFVMSSISSGGHGVGMEIPFASVSIFEMSGEPDRSKRNAFAKRFYDENRYWALCVGFFEQPIWPMYDPRVVVEWDQRPNANENLYGINNIRSIKLK